MECEKCGAKFGSKHALWGHKAGCDGAEWKTEKRLRELYWGREMSIRDIADEVNTGQTNVIHHLDRHGIDRRSISEARGGHDGYQDKETLERMYVDERMSLKEIGEHFGVDQSTIRYWMGKLGVDTRPRLEAVKTKTTSFFTTRAGYEVAASSHGSVRVHQLVAIANGEDPHQVFKQGIDIHHKNGIPWDNRSKNIEVLPHSEHQKITSSVYYGERSYNEQ